jgi:hypothetical protein
VDNIKQQVPKEEKHERDQVPCRVLATKYYRTDKITRKYMHAETLALLTKPLYFPNMKYEYLKLLSW